MTAGARQALEAAAGLGASGALRGVSIGGQWIEGGGTTLATRSPINGEPLTELTTASDAQVDAAIDAAAGAFTTWRLVPAPVRGQFVREFGEQLRRHKSTLATIVSWEAGKITQEALGEVQEMIDICDFAVGLSRQLYGRTIASERPGHRLAEQWHPLGPIGVITAFNFPVAVWAWNAAHRLGLRRSGRVEAVGEDAAQRHRVPAAGAADPRRRGRRARGDLERRDRRPRGRRAAGGLAEAAAHFGNRVRADGTRGRRNRGAAARPLAPRARRQQRDDRDAVGRSSAGGPLDRLRRRRHMRPAMHDAAAPHRPRIDRRHAARSAARGVCTAADRRPHGPWHSGRADDRREGRPGHGRGPRRREGIGRHRPRRRPCQLGRARRRLLREAGDCRDRRGGTRRATGDVCADSLPAPLPHAGRGDRHSQRRRRKGCHRPFSRARFARRSSSARRRVPTAGWST